jgi:protein SCO1/2/putative membrane protein
LIVAATVAVAGILSSFVPPPKPTRAAFDLAGTYPPLGPFSLVERSGRATTDADLAGGVWIAGFVFTRCNSSCPRITTAMKGVLSKLDRTGVRMVSVSVDPEFDTPDRLTRYATAFGADPMRWWFLTGDKAVVYNLIRDQFKLSVAPVDPSDPTYELMDIAHSDRLALVDRGNRLVGLYNANDRAEMDELIARAKRLDKAWVTRLPLVNASLNGLSLLLLLIGWILIRTGRMRGHITTMISALTVSALFLACYLVYHANIGGGVPFRGVGPLRWVYFTILISHVVLAAAMVPLILLLVLRAIRRRFDRHARLARVTLPIWLYVAATGVVVYLMLYQWPMPAAAWAG